MTGDRDEGEGMRRPEGSHAAGDQLPARLRFGIWRKSETDGSRGDSELRRRELCGRVLGRGEMGLIWIFGLGLRNYISGLWGYFRKWLNIFFLSYLFILYT